LIMGDMAVVKPPVELMAPQHEHLLPVRALPAGPFALEPKLDGWRCYAAAGRVLTRHQKDITRRFPELVEAVDLLGDVVVDGELCALRGGRLDFQGLTLGRQRRDIEGVEVFLVAFDLLAVGRRDLRRKPYTERRVALLELLPAPRPDLQPIESTTDEARAHAVWFTEAAALRGIEGVVLKPLTGTYGDPRNPWIKRRWRLTTDVLVIGVTGDVDQPHALVLGYPDPAGTPHTVGISLPLAREIRAALAGRLHATGQRTVMPTIAIGLSGRHREVPYVPVAPHVTVEIEADASVEMGRWRHPPKVIRVRAFH
jgi:ATP-dependent DNA ligase